MATSEAGRPSTRRYAGGCHCGAISFAFTSAKPLAPRACQCGFCRKRGARTLSDPAGSVSFRFAGPAPVAYRFASRSAGYVVCPGCGVYVAAVAELDDGAYATLNLDAFDEPHLELAGEPVSYEGETVAGKAARRRERWTPVTGRLPEGLL
jgi:hypothetical protein